MRINTDPSSSDSEFAILYNAAFYVLNQRITLPRGIHLTTLVVERLDGETWTPLVVDTDFTTNVDQDGQSEALLEDDEYADSVIGSIDMVGSPSGGVDTLRITGVGLRLDPIGSTTYLTNVVSDLLSPVLLLEEDLTGVNDDNLIVEELHYVSTPNGKQFIRPGAGPFYSHDIVVKTAAGTVLTPNVDYLVVGIDATRTKLTYHTSSVSSYLALLSPYTGTLKVTYRAFGGVFTTDDGYRLKASLEAIIEWLTAGAILNTRSDAWLDLLARVGLSENKISSLWTGGFGGTYASYSLSVADLDEHWFTLAKMHRSCTGEIATTGTGTIRIRAISGLSMDIWISVDADLARTGSEMWIHPIVAFNPVSVNPSTVDYRLLDLQIVPRVRLVWDSDSPEAGALLQIAFPANLAEIDDIIEVIVENRSMSNSPWVVEARIAAAHGDVDDELLLPDGATTWTDGVGTATKLHRPIGYANGLLLYAGTCPMADDRDGVILYGPMNGSQLVAGDISRLTFMFYDKYTNTVHTANANIAACSPGTLASEIALRISTFFFPQDLCNLDVIIDATADDQPLRITVGPSAGGNSKGVGMTQPRHRFDLLQIAAFF